MYAEVAVHELVCAFASALPSGDGCFGEVGFTEISRMSQTKFAALLQDHGVPESTIAKLPALATLSKVFLFSFSSAMILCFLIDFLVATARILLERVGNGRFM